MLFGQLNDLFYKSVGHPYCYRLNFKQFDVPTDIKLTRYFPKEFSSQAYQINFLSSKPCVHLQSK